MGAPPGADELCGLRGWRAGPSAWRTIEQADIEAFAALTGDRQWIHVDVERARRESPYGTTIAHGNLTLSLIDGFRDELMGAAGERLGRNPSSSGPDPGAGGSARLGINYGYDRVRFAAAVPSGARVRARVQIISVDPRADGWWQMVARFTIELEGATKPACVADSVVWVRPGS